MASSNGVQSFQQPFQCKECGLALNSAESLEVHLQYHQENLMQQWAVKAQSSSEEKNNNMTKAATAIKREFPSSNVVTTDSSDIQKKSPDYQRNTPEAIYGHPPTPQSYQSASSPYQNHENSAFSPNFQNFPLVKSEGNSPASQQQSRYQNSFSNFAEQHQFFNMESANQYSQEMNIKHSSNNIYHYHPYQTFGRPKSRGGAPPDASPAYPPQPTPSPSPKQCDKCGYVCESAAQLIEHNNITHSNNPQVQSQYPQGNQHYMFDQQTLKEEDVSQSEILDLDSHKVVHPVWAESKEEDKRPNGESSNPHSVSAMLNSWPSPPQQQQPNMFQGEHNMFINESGDQKMFSSLPNISENKVFSADQKIFQPHQMGNQNFINNGVSSSNPEMGTTNQQSFRSFEHLPNPPSSVISSTQVPQVPTANAGPPPNNVKGANWKSNEARRPKTYQCTACNKWFTSSGHLKRHYNTTLHKNAVKSSGQPDPATLPISAHHHPSRDSAGNKEDRANSGSPRDDLKEDNSGMGSQFDNRSMPGLLQHPPNGPYDRQSMHHTTSMHSPIAQHHTSLGNPSPLGSHMMQNSNFSNMPNGSPPNGDAGLSPADSRGLLSMAPPPHSFNMMSQPPMMPPMEATQFQMYPNGSAPHVSQATDTTSNLSTTGELQFVVENENQPLPSFAQIQAHRFGIGYANVGGLGSVTTPASFTYYTTEQFDLNEAAHLLLKESHANNNQLPIITSEDVMQHSPGEVTQIPQYSPTSLNNNNNEIKMEINYDELEVNHGEHTDLTYLSPASAQSQSLSSELEHKLVISTNAQEEESKENYEENAGVSPSISSTTAVPSENESKTKCYECDKEFNRPCYLTQHNRTCHEGDKPYKCERCGKRYSTEPTLNTHKKKHAGNKPHKCERCPKMFNHKTDLRRHDCVHTGKKPYACDICGKGFIRKDHMVKHKDTHLRKRGKLGAMRS